LEFSHLDKDGHPRMVDVSDKTTTLRSATAVGTVNLTRDVFVMIEKGQVKKGDVLQIAELAGINTLKKTWELIPLCHSIRLDHASVKCSLDNSALAVRITCLVKAREVTGVEMEALTGVTGAALTIYDMCKGVDKSIVISDIRLLSKTGGKSGTFIAKERKEIIE